MAKNNDAYSINDSNISKEDLLDIYKSFATISHNNRVCQPHDLDYIFDVAVDNKSFPNIKISGDKNETVYVEHWISNYNDAMSNLPSSHFASPKSTCSDPAIKLLVQMAHGSNDNEATTQESYHNLYMSAENIQGLLLEEYIASNIRQYGFLWCNGNVMRATDFCTTNGTVLLQVKNKNNTENSSSSNIREGTEIVKWYRLGTGTSNGQIYPKFRWELLNDIINRYKTEGFNLPPCNMSEEDYENFLRDVASNNPNLLNEH